MKKYLFAGIAFLFLAGCGTQYMNAGKIYLQEREYAKASEQFKAQLGTNPQDPDALWWLGETSVQQKNYEDACEYFDKVIKFAPTYPELTKEKTFLWGVYHNAGLKSAAGEKRELALKRFYTAVGFEPESVITYLTIAQTWSQDNKDDSALVWYKKIIDIAPKDAEAYKGIGIFYVKNKNYKDAITYLKKAAELKPKSADITYRLGAAYYFLEDYTNAKESFNRVIEYDSTFADAYFDISAVLIKQQDYKAAKEVLNKYIALKPKDEEALSNLGSLYLLTKEYNQALGTYSKLIELQPDSAGYYEGRANVYLQLGKKDSSNVDARKAQDLRKKK